MLAAAADLWLEVKRTDWARDAITAFNQSVIQAKGGHVLDMLHGIYPADVIDGFKREEQEQQAVGEELRMMQIMEEHRKRLEAAKGKK